MADEPVVIVDYDPSWRTRFDEQRRRVTETLTPWLAGPVEHVGSTAVPGLPAKPVVDMLAPVRSLDDARTAEPLLERDGWWSWPDDPNRAWRLWFLYPRPEARTHHLHVVEQGHVQAEAILTFRDALRSDDELTRRYAELKRQLASRHRTTRNAYTNAKAEFVSHALRAVGFDPPPMDELPV